MLFFTSEHNYARHSSSHTIPLDALLHKPNNDSGNPGWSSVIGIVTAIIGNVLISFALNTQRYAHIRLERQQTERESGSDKSVGKARQSDQHNEAKKRGMQGRAMKDQQDRDADLEAGSTCEGQGDGETDPLLPRQQRHTTKDCSECNPTNNHADEKTSERGKRGSYLKSPYWWIGIVLMVVGEAGNFLAYGFAPASIVSPLGVVALISNCLIAPVMLHEQFRKQDVLGVLIAVGGAVTVVLSASGNNPKLGPDEIWDLIKRWEFLTYLGVTITIIVILMIASNRYGHTTLTIDVGLVGLFGGYTALSTKGVASLLSYTLWRALTFPITYLLVAVLVVTAVLQIKYVNRALQRFDSTQVIPTQFVMFTILVITGSAVLYRDFESTTASKVGQFVGGCALTFLGVWCLTSGRTDHNKNEHDDDNAADENTMDLSDEEIDEEGEGYLDSGSNADSKKNFGKDKPTSRARPAVHNPFHSARTSFETDVLHPSAAITHSPASFATASSHMPHLAPLSVPEVQGPGKSTQSNTTVISSSSVPTTTVRRMSDCSLLLHCRSLVSSSTDEVHPRTHSHRASSPSFRPCSQSLNTAPSPRRSLTTFPQQSQRQRLVSRRSLAAGMTPSPLTAPLGASLSAIVGNLRRREDLRQQFRESGPSLSEAAITARAITLHPKQWS